MQDYSISIANECPFNPLPRATWWRTGDTAVLHWAIEMTSLNIVSIYLTHWGRVTHICVGNLTIIEVETRWPPFWPDDIFNCIFLNEKVWILIKISLKFVPKGPINKIPSLVQIMAWCRPGEEPLSEPMMVSLLTHICVTRPQWAGLGGVLLGYWCCPKWETWIYQKHCTRVLLGNCFFSIRTRIHVPFSPQPCLKVY